MLIQKQAQTGICQTVENKVPEILNQISDYYILYCLSRKMAMVKMFYKIWLIIVFKSDFSSISYNTSSKIWLENSQNSLKMGNRKLAKLSTDLVVPGYVSLKLAKLLSYQLSRDFYNFKCTGIIMCFNRRYSSMIRNVVNHSMMYANVFLNFVENVILFSRRGISHLNIYLM